MTSISRTGSSRELRAKYFLEKVLSLTCGGNPPTSLPVFLIRATCHSKSPNGDEEQAEARHVDRERSEDLHSAVSSKPENYAGATPHAHTHVEAHAVASCPGNVRAIFSGDG